MICRVRFPPCSARSSETQPAAALVACVHNLMEKVMYAQSEFTQSPESSGPRNTARHSGMGFSTIKKAVGALFALLLAGSTAHAADPNAPPKQLCPGMMYVKFANPPCWPIGTYWPWQYANQQLAVSGANSPIGVHSIATQFTVAKSGAAAKILVALSYVSGTDNAANISVYDDAGGLPGKPIQTRRMAPLPPAAACCSYETVVLEPEVKLLGALLIGLLPPRMTTPIR
jgi:hypothetical protein